MALTQRGINIPVTGQFQDGDDIVDALRAQGMSVDAALGGLGAVANLSPEALDALAAFDAEVDLSAAIIDGRTRSGNRPVGQDEIVINAADHGVTPGDSGARAALQDLVDQMPPTGGTILLPPGTITFDDMIGQDHYIRIKGHGGRRSTILLDYDGPAFGRAGTGRHDALGLSDFRIQRTSNTSTNPIIDLTGVTESDIERLDIQDIAGGSSTAAAILLDGQCYYNRLYGNQVRNARTAYMFQNQANRNLVLGGKAVSCYDAYVLDDVNSNRLIAVAGETLGNDGVRVQNDALSNLMLGVSIEDVGGACFAVRAETAGLEPIWNIFAFCYASPAGGVDWALNYSNYRIDHSNMSALIGNRYLSDTYVRAYLGSSQSSLSAETWTKVGYDTVVTDHNNEFSGGTVTVTRAGVYDIAASARLNSSSAGAELDLAVYVNGSLRVQLDRKVSGATYTILSGGLPLLLSAGDAVEIWARSSASGIGITSGGAHSYFQIARHG